MITAILVIDGLVLFTAALLLIFGYLADGRQP